MITVSKEIKWTTEQELAISFRGSSAVVSAAAGSGKTAVLIERVIRILMDEENPVSADKIVIATFTEKAAGELKTRLNNALSKAIAENPHNDYLKSQLLSLEDASISTISAFCIRLLRNNSAAVGLSPDFTILDEAEGAIMRSRSLEAVLEEFYETADDNDRDLLYDWYGGENDGEICRNTEYIRSYLEDLPHREETIKKLTETYENPEKYEKDFQKMQAEALLLPLADAVYDILSSADRNEEKCENFFTEWDGYYDRLIDAIKNNDTDELTELSKIKYPPIPRKTKDFDSSYIKSVSESIKEKWDKIKKICGSGGSYVDSMRLSCPVFRLLVELAIKTDNEYAKRKRLKNKLDFADAEIMALRLLSDERYAPDIRKSVSVIIVDEFQDSNDMQYEIFRKLSSDGNNLFFVGDIKQSIYRFRGANPLVFAGILEDPGFTNIYLNKNFRSSVPVIDSVNGIFEGTMTKELGEVDYDENAKLINGAEYEYSDENKTELIRIHAADMEQARRDEAAYVAYRIKDMVEKRFQVTEKGIKRDCCYGDFAVLMGKYRTNAHIYKKAFIKAGIPFDAKEDGAFTDLYEIKLMLSLLRVIDNPYYDNDMAAVLSLPPYSFTSDELAQAKVCGGKKHKNLYTAVSLYADESPKAKEFMDDFRELRDFSEEHSVEQLIRRIYDESDITPSILAMPDGDKRNSNLKLLISYAARFSDNGSKGIYDFLSFMETVSLSDARLAQAQNAAEEADSVKIMTIHGSKGLEFPVCIVANLSSAYHKGGAKGVNKIIADIDCGIGMKVVDSKRRLIINSPMYSFMDSLNTNRELSQEMRLLYVAATRAKEKLIFTAPLKPVRKYDCHLKWISESIAVKRGLIKVEDLYGFNGGAEETPAEEAAEEIIIKPFTQYEYMKYSEIPAKVTATQVGVKSVDDYAEKVHGVDRFLRMPSFIKNSEEKKLSGKKKGDAYHKAMELLDFRKGAEQLDVFYAEGKLTKPERSCINNEEIKAFLKSDLCRRINASPEVHKEFPVFCEYSDERIPEGEEKPFVQGIADLFFIEDGEIVLVDYKTNTGVTPETLREEYEGQLRVYADALAKLTGRKVKQCVLWSFTLSEQVEC